MTNEQKFLKLAKKNFVRDYGVILIKELRSWKLQINSYIAGFMFNEDGEMFNVRGKTIENCFRKGIKKLKKEIKK